jgi:DNA-binding transcriptional LysR family regulator
MVLIAPPGHSVADSGSVDLATLQDEYFVVREKGSGTRLMTEKALNQAGLPGFSSFRVVAEMGSTEAVRQAVKAGIGLAIVSERAVEEDVAHGLLVSIALKGIDLTRKFYLVWRRRRTLSPLARDFMEFIRVCAREKTKNSRQK